MGMLLILILFMLSIAWPYMLLVALSVVLFVIVYKHEQKKQAESFEKWAAGQTPLSIVEADLNNFSKKNKKK